MDQRKATGPHEEQWMRDFRDGRQGVLLPPKDGAQLIDLGDGQANIRLVLPGDKHGACAHYGQFILDQARVPSDVARDAMPHDVTVRYYCANGKHRGCLLVVMLATKRVKKSVSKLAYCVLLRKPEGEPDDLDARAAMFVYHTLNAHYPQRSGTRPRRHEEVEEDAVTALQWARRL